MTDYTISAVDEALALLLIVAQKPGLGVTELAKASGNTKARAFRILFTLEQRNFVLRKNPGPCYFLDIQALYIGVAAQEQIALVRTARQYLLALGRECNENVQLRVRDGLECVCIDHWQSTRTTKMKSGAGSRRKLHAGASCKLLLAHAPPEVKHALLNSELLRYSKNTITQRSSDGEITPDVMAIAVPIFNAQNEVVAALSLAGTKLRFEEQHAHYLQRLNHYADLLSSALKTVA
jgi:DNA-binding IclR family transcriptional regulator